MLEFKWKSYAQSLYWINAAYFLIFLILVVASSISASRSSKHDCDTLKKLFNNDCDENTSQAMFLFPITSLVSLSYLRIEIDDLRSEGLFRYVKAGTNYLDIPAFTLQITSSLFWFIWGRTNHKTAAVLLALSVLGLMTKLICKEGTLKTHMLTTVNDCA
jgi:hypothetical protein